MLISIPAVLTKDQVGEFRARLAEAPWVDGAVTAGKQSGVVKHNMQVPEDWAAKTGLGDAVIDAIGSSELFVSAALPLKTYPPLFNRYRGGEHFGAHIDNAIRPVRGTFVRIRTDLSCTLFLSEPDEYDGGELVIEDAFGAQEVKLAAGDMVLYPSSSLHLVRPVTRGERLASFFWVQSMVRDDGQRTVLFDLDQSIQTLARDNGVDHPVTVRLSGVYHNLVRRWAEA